MKKKETKESVLKEIYTNRNHSWFDEIKNRSQDNLEKTALKYRGKEISYKEYLETCEQVWAPALYAAGIRQGTEIVVSLGSTPELCFLLGAISILGAKANIITKSFDKEYVKEICQKADSEYVFLGEDRFNELAPTISTLNKKIIPVDLNHSLKNGNPYEAITDCFIDYDKEEYQKLKTSLSNVEDLDILLERGKGKDYVRGNTGLEDVFTITYSSGTTDGNKPKGIVHRNKHYIVMGRYHDSEISGIPNMKNSTTFSNIPTQSNSYIASILSDTLMEGATIGLDPIDTKEYFLYGLLINKPYMAIATTSTWLYCAKLYYSLPKEKRKIFVFPNTIFPVAVGEPLSPGEEKYLNKFIADTKCGIAITKLPHSISKISTCGGDCEHGSIFIRELRVYANLKKDRRVKEPIGLRTYDFVEVKALRPDGTYCKPMEYGRLVANSECTMVGYKDHPDRTEKFYITDAYGKKWGDLGCYGFIDADNNTYMKGRMNEDKSVIPEFMVNDVIQIDTKNILSSSVVCSEQDGEEKYIAYIDVQPRSRKSVEAIKQSVIARLYNRFGNDLINNLYIRMLKPEEEFPLTGCIKRDNNYLRRLGLTKECEKASPVVQAEKPKTLAKNR